MSEKMGLQKVNRKRLRLLLLVLLFILGAFSLVSCLNAQEVHSSIPEEFTPVMTYEVLSEFPHDPQAFTQGLVYHEGFLYESTGLYGESSLRKVDLETGKVLEQLDLADEFFAEGLAIYENKLYQLTWREGTGFIYSLEDFALFDQFTYQTEGWGLAHDGQHLIMSDGTNKLYFLDPGSMQIMETIEVTFMGEAITRLNELEYIRGELFANIWQKDYIVRIDPETGDVLGILDLTGILPEELQTPETDVLNGIAYDPAADRLFITGKRWQRLYEIRLLPSAFPFPNINN